MKRIFMKPFGLFLDTDPIIRVSFLFSLTVLFLSLFFSIDPVSVASPGIATFLQSTVGRRTIGGAT